MVRHGESLLSEIPGLRWCGVCGTGLQVRALIRLRLIFLFFEARVRPITPSSKITRRVTSRFPPHLPEPHGSLRVIFAKTARLQAVSSRRAKAAISPTVDELKVSTRDR